MAYRLFRSEDRHFTKISREMGKLLTKLLLIRKDFGTTPLAQHIRPLLQSCNTAGEPASIKIWRLGRAIECDDLCPFETHHIARERNRFPVCSKWRQFEPEVILLAVGCICVFPCRTGTSRSCLPSEACTPITSRCGVGSSGMPQKWNDVCALGSGRPTTVGEWTKPTSGSRASGSIYTGLSTPAVRRNQRDQPVEGRP